MIDSIRLQHFRSYTDGTFEFDGGVNIIVGPNASGKTNLLEALLVTAVGRSYRARDSELIQFKKPWARLEAHTSHAKRVVKIEITDSAIARKRFVLDDQTLARLSLAKSLPIVLFEPNELQLLTNAPEQRRLFLDNLIGQTVTGYNGLLRQYRRAVAQRNSLLKKTPNPLPDQLFAWNIRLSELGGQIVSQRVRLIERFNKSLSRLYGQLANRRTRARLTYQTACDVDNYSSSLLKRLEKTTEQDAARGHTSHGPHRDDILIELNGHPLQSTASRGETRSLLLALKLVELQLVEELRAKSPLLLLDDVFSELDGARRHALTDFLVGHQSFITTTDADVVVQHFLADCHIIPLQRTFKT